jgi:ClpP class serine protease
MEMCKADRVNLHELLKKTEKELQDYFAGQMKPLWMILQSLTKQQTNIEERLSSGSGSFFVV